MKTPKTKTTLEKAVITI